MGGGDIKIAYGEQSEDILNCVDMEATRFSGESSERGVQLDSQSQSQSQSQSAQGNVKQDDGDSFRVPLLRYASVIYLFTGSAVNVAVVRTQQPAVK
uniref:Uncharacterized protein n=1 Tax=Glossina palpalis gambiensis TaxID=67801 RepID=A0A1B0B4Q3_9MUSC